MKRKITIILLLITFILTACGGGYETEISQENAKDVSVRKMDEAAEEELGTTAEGTADSVKVTDTSRKLIKNVNISAETRKFDGLLETLNKQVSQLKGYIQSSEIRGNNYNHNSNRYAEYVIRIPAEKLSEFITTVKDSANITRESENVEDITLQYVDTESHIKALKTELESLMKMLETANKLDDIFKIQSRLTEVRYEIESYESQLRSYDNLVTYSTVYLDISEVERETATEDVSFWGSIKERFRSSLYNIKEGGKYFIIWFVGSLPYIIILAAVLGFILLVIKKVDRKNRRRKIEQQEKEIKSVDDTDVNED